MLGILSRITSIGPRVAGRGVGGGRNSPLQMVLVGGMVLRVLLKALVRLALGAFAASLASRLPLAALAFIPEATHVIVYRSLGLPLCLCVSRPSTLCRRRMDMVVFLSSLRSWEKALFSLPLSLWR